MATTSQELEEQDVQSIKTFIESVCSSEFREPSGFPPLSYASSERIIDSEESEFSAQRLSDDRDDDRNEEDEDRYPGWRRTVPITISFYVALIIVALVSFSPFTSSTVSHCSYHVSQKRSSTQWPPFLPKRLVR